MTKSGIFIGAFCLLFSISLTAHKTLTSAQNGSQADTLDYPRTFGFGRAATLEEIALLDTDVRPDGKGLPAGSGKVADGKLVYAAKCSGCHGVTGVEGPNDALVTVKNPADQKTKARSKTIGNYWPYATTVFDYIKRAMPFNQPGSLTDQDVYNLTAFLLHENGLIKPDEVINAQTLPKVIMPARDFFVPDDRQDGPEIR
ncbi:cytochrome c [Dyadobacter sp. LHD-138]|uniref:c-type cytochrome n=1 Tax=Dyadobacter sp. LHD-138 TaxID=3071413 RepID=UPI0027E1950B|nr:cytochrome c [Dyadobacter sp. LHD-138]MDQ6481074.1 cytochrome c [Dyadobacter sp. LHD-138]